MLPSSAQDDCLVGTVADRKIPTSLGKVLGILDVVASGDPYISIRELSRRSGIARSTAQRLVSELLSAGLLERDRRGLRLGSKLLELGQVVQSRPGLRDMAFPFAVNLSAATRLAVKLAVRQGDEITYVTRIDPRTVRAPQPIRRRSGTLYATGVGKAILAFSDPDLVEHVSTRLRAVTSRTVTDAPRLQRELAKVRRGMVAFDIEESNPGVICVAAPILDARGTPIGAISVRGVESLSRADKLAPAVRGTAMEIGRAMRPLFSQLSFG